MWTGSAAARQWRISAPATCGWSLCHLPGTRRRCWTSTATLLKAAQPVCTGRRSLPGRRSHPVAAAETCLVLERWRAVRLWGAFGVGAHGLQTFCCSLPYYTCPGIPPIRTLYSINLDPLRGYLPLTSTICHRVQFKATGASCAPTPTLVQLASTCVQSPSREWKLRWEKSRLMNYFIIMETTQTSGSSLCWKSRCVEVGKYSRDGYSIIPFITNIVTTSLHHFKTNKYAQRSQHSVVKIVNI